MLKLIENSSEDSEEAESEYLEDFESVKTEHGHIRKTLALENETDETVTKQKDDNKENSICSTLDFFKKNKEPFDKIYPNLNDIKDVYGDDLIKPQDSQQLAMNYGK